MEVKELMSVDELKTKIRSREIDSIYIELQNEGVPFIYPLFIMSQSLYNYDYFDCRISRTRFMRFYYKDYMIKFWTKGDKSE